MKKKKLKYSILQNMIFLFREIAVTYPFLFALIFLEIVLSVISPVFGIYFPSLAVHLVTDHADLQTLLFKLGGLGLLMALTLGFKQMAAEGKYYMYNNMRAHFQIQLFYQSLHCDYINIESKEGQTKYQRAQNSLFAGDWSGTSRMVVSTIAIITNILSFVIYSTILSMLHPLIVVMLIVLSVINLLMIRSAQNYEHNFKDKTAGLEQKMDYVEYTAKDVKYGKDIRLYNMSSWFLDLREQLTESSRKLFNLIRNRYFLVSCFNHLTLFLRDGIAYGYLIYCVSTGRIAVSDFVLYFGAVSGFSGFIQEITSHYNELNAANLMMNDMRAFLDTTDEAEPENPASLPEEKNLTIDFNHVWFSYSKDTEPVLKDFNLHIAPGEKIALVGVNGAGKTTLVKLLCGLYHPDRGEILINGINTRNFRKEDLFELFSAVFQDIYISPHTVAENISMVPEDETDMERVQACLKEAGIWDVIDSYPDSIHSFMNKAVHDGILLSGGQQQKLLMARALYKDAPVMILDEPTAALDPIAESETYESFHSISGDRTVLYISHRLASTRFCDRIVFLKNGQVSETGTHEDLMQQGGDYAEMFEVQSHYYQKGGMDHEKAQTIF